MACPFDEIFAGRKQIPTGAWALSCPWHGAHAPLVDPTPWSPSPGPTGGTRRQREQEKGQHRTPPEKWEAGTEGTTCEPRLQAPSDLSTNRKSKVKFIKNVEMWPQSIKHQHKAALSARPCAMSLVACPRSSPVPKEKHYYFSILQVRKLKHREDN